MSTLIQNTEQYMFDLLTESLDSSFVYHNLAHTQRVVEAVKEIAAGENVSETDTENLILAAWFHDSGFVDNAEGHEQRSAQIAGEFLSKEGVAPKKIKEVQRLILCTKMDVEPNGPLEEIMKDADSSHIASSDYFDYTRLLRQEWEFSKRKKYNEIEWINVNIAFVTKLHSFHTDFARKNWTEGKEKNLAKLLKNKKKQKKDKKKFKQKEKSIRIKNKKYTLPERGIETMFRVALRNHITLSDIADTKANILLSVNAIIVSLALSNLIPKLDNISNRHLLIPTLIFVIFTVVTIIMSIIATRPNVTEGEFTKEDVANKKVNLVFFGNFHKMKLEDYEWAMGEMLKDRDYLYGSLTKDLYFLGLVLNRKYKLLRYTYTVFMIGIIVSVLAFAISFNYKQ